jgi:hypothetical protein
VDGAVLMCYGDIAVLDAGTGLVTGARANLPLASYREAWTVVHSTVVCVLNAFVGEPTVDGQLAKVSHPARIFVATVDAVCRPTLALGLCLLDRRWRWRSSDPAIGDAVLLRCSGHPPSIAHSALCPVRSSSCWRAYTPDMPSRGDLWKVLPIAQKAMATAIIVFALSVATFGFSIGTSHSGPARHSAHTPTTTTLPDTSHASTTATVPNTTPTTITSPTTSERSAEAREAHEAAERDTHASTRATAPTATSTGHAATAVAPPVPTTETTPPAHATSGAQEASKNSASVPSLDVSVATGSDTNPVAYISAGTALLSAIASVITAAVALRARTSHSKSAGVKPSRDS